MQTKSLGVTQPPAGFGTEPSAIYFALAVPANISGRARTKRAAIKSSLVLLFILL
jgi:hypothetical protein